MTTKKITGYLFLLLAVLLSLAIVGQLPKVAAAFLGIYKLLLGTADSYEGGLIIGQLIYWVFHFAVTGLLWMYGKKWALTKD